MVRKIVIVVSACLVFAGTFILKNVSEEKSSQAVVQETLKPAALPRLVDLGSDKCIPCKKMAPILENLAEQYQGALIVEVIDIKKDPAAGEPWNIRVIPTQIFLDASGQELFRHEGFMAQEAIVAKWQELGVVLQTSRPAEET